jgi:glycosyltransferase involved in cell wall biosynthesis
MRLAIVQFGGDFSDIYRRLVSGKGATYHAHQYVLDSLLQLSERLEEIIYITCRTEQYHNVQLQPKLRSIGAGLDPYQQVDDLIALLEEQNLTHVIFKFPQRKLFRWASRNQIKTLGIIADSFEGRSWRNRIWNFLLARSLNHPNVDWVGNHGVNACRSLQRIGVSADKIVPWDWIHPTTPSQFTVRTLSQSTPHRMLYVGLIAEAKGVGDAIASVAELKRRQVPVRLTLAGKGDLDQFQDLARQLQIENQVQFLGLIPHQQILEEMRSADVLVVPSHHAYPEGFPLTVYEGLCTRTPLVVSDHPMFEGILRDRINAMVFPERNAIALADGVQQLVSNPQLYTQLSQASEAAWQHLQIPVKWADLIERWLFDSPENRRWLSDYSLGSGRYDRTSKPAEFITQVN